MEQAILLLKSAIALLLMIGSSTTPIPEDIRIQAESVARQAIAVATESIEESTEGTGGTEDAEDIEDLIEEPTPPPIPAPTMEVKIVKAQSKNIYAVGQSIEIAVILTGDGSENLDSLVEMATPDITQYSSDSYANTKSQFIKTPFYDFHYTPMEAGEHELFFQGNGLNKSIIINAK